MNTLKIHLLNKKLFKEFQIEDKRGFEHKIKVLIKDCLPVLKDINPSKEEVDYFFNNIVAIQEHSREFDHLIIS